MRENFVYRYGRNLYVNLTNRCPNHCSFCIRQNGDGIGDSGCLWLDREPSAEECIRLIDREGDYEELVFCGYGEPTCRADVMLKIARNEKNHGHRIRLNTNGLGNLICGRDITGELCEVIDVISVSLNAASKEAYDRLCKSDFGPGAFDEMIDFTRKCKEKGAETVMSVVEVDGADVEGCRKIAESAGVVLRVRAYIP